MTAAWPTDDRAESAATHLLDVAERLFETHGVDAVTMRQIADAAGCSRATLYRYFSSREDLQLAYVNRSARLIAQSVADSVDSTQPSEARLIAATSTAIAGVRANPALMAWFSPTSAGSAADLAMLSPAIEAVVIDFLAHIAVDAGRRSDCAQWLVRVIVSLLTRPAESVAAEEALLRQFVVPVIA